MTDYESIEESPFYEKAKKYVEETKNNDYTIEAYIAGATENSKWHDLQKYPTDVPNGKDIHRKILLQDRHGNIYTGNYFPEDNCHPEKCFAVEYLDWGFQGSNFVAFEQIAKWAEFKE